MSRDKFHGSPSQVIVVGIDGSRSSQCALRWALCQAELTGASLKLVLAWNAPASVSGCILPGPMHIELEEGSRGDLDQLVVDILGKAPTVTVSTVVIEGPADDVLLEAAKDAVLLVVGVTGDGPHPESGLGSVSQHCASQSPCPVVIVRAPRAPALD